ncbi:hypothetical protein D9613_000843 [Agrocybe pediades]|uniref:FAD dependent oxidoreductase domain-containing protein n=1 Tax=Agrocybe pediades TaxID=84607 RepID=A0A8H4VT98_9AGAR|nr:hypothetical protein D9613_000843 [Agrocybe pediades]
MTLRKDDKIVIVGAGCFGVSTAYHLLERGYTDVTILDRSNVLPAPDAASNDINRIVRSSYDDKFYTLLARQAIASWKDQEKWGDSYHESGVLVLGLSDTPYADEAYKNDVSLGASVRTLRDSDAIRSVFPAQVQTGTFADSAGFLNHDGGWANAGQGLARLIDHVKKLNGKFLPGTRVANLCRDSNGRTTGVQTADGSVLDASLVIIASGSWTASTFSELELGHICLATGQSVAMVQLTESEAEKYRNCPVVFDFVSGFYVFPPNEKNIVKVAIHAAGYTYFKDADTKVSTPRTITSDPENGLLIPKPMLKALREELRKIYPELAEKPFIGTRLCWYNDTPDGHWVIGRYPGDASLVIATGGSGHAYKFLPVIGRLVADLVEDKLEPEVVEKLAVNKKRTTADGSRSGEVVQLHLQDLYSPEDLQAV